MQVVEAKLQKCPRCTAIRELVTKRDLHLTKSVSLVR